MAECQRFFVEAGELREAKPARKVTRREFSRSARPLRTSEILRNILTKNPDAESFTIEEIGQALGETSFGTALMFFTIPEVIPIRVPGIAASFNMPQAMATFIIAFGLVENDGLIVIAGVIVGRISLAILGRVVFGLFSFLGFSGL
jgi:hypothetical protein